MFKKCSYLESLNLSNFNCYNIKKPSDIEEMFKDCSKLKIGNVKYDDFKIRDQLIIDLNKQ